MHAPIFYDFLFSRNLETTCNIRYSKYSLMKLPCVNVIHYLNIIIIQCHHYITEFRILI